MKKEWTLAQSICAMVIIAALFLLAARIETLVTY